jgi:hypothetical protein
MTTKHLTFICMTGLLLSIGCASDGADDEPTPDEPTKAQLRAAVQQAADEGTDAPVCPDAWLGDGVCDDFCENDTTDCEVHCLSLDCPGNGDEGDGDADDGDADEDDGVACAAIFYPTDGVCEPGPGCEHNDPVDCGVSTDGGDEDDGEDDGIVCTLEVRERDGVCADGPCDPDCEASATN